MNSYSIIIDLNVEPIRVSLLGDDKEIESILPSGLKLTDSLLLEIDKLLKKHNLKKNNIGEIVVNPGPGSYTSLRVGLTTANLLAFSLNIPIRTIYSKSHISQDYTSPIMPKYGNNPNITSPKTRLK